MGASVHLLFGTDEYLVSSKASALVDELVPESERALGLETIDGTSDNASMALAALDQCLAALRTMSFMGTGKTVVLRSATFLADTVAARAEAVKGKVGELTELVKSGLQAGDTLVVTSPKVDKRSSFYKVFKQVGEVHEYNLPERSHQAHGHAVNVVRQQVSTLGLQMSSDVVDYFVERVGTETRLLVSEMEKLSLFMGARTEVATEDVAAICCTTHDALVWDLADAVGQRDLAGAVKVARRLALQKQNSIGLICSLENRIRDLIIYREALQRKWLQVKASGAEWIGGESEADLLFAGMLSGDPRSTHPYRAKILAEQARRFTMAELLRALQALVHAHETLVSSPVPSHIVIETLLVQIMGRRG